MSFPWIKLYSNLPEHPKSDLLEVELKAPRAWTYVVQLWLWASKVRPSGDLSGLPPEIVARRSGWEGDATAFVDALRVVGFLDGDLLHGWEDEQGAHMRKAERDKDRAAKRRADAKAAKEAQSLATVARPSHEPSAAVAGERRGEERRGEESESTALAAAEEPERAHKPGAAPSGATVRTQHRRFASRMPHEQELWRETPEELLAAPDPAQPSRTFAERLTERYPALDGQRGRPTVLDRLRAKWPAFEKKFFAHGPASAFPAVVDWIGEGYDRHRRDWERDGNIDPAAMRASRDGLATSGATPARRPRPVPDKDDDVVAGGES